MKKPRTGRPAEFRHRVRLPVFFEARELRQVQARARAERISASAFVRRAVLAALAETGEGR
jgi:hypothetical protein